MQDSADKTPPADGSEFDRPPVYSSVDLLRGHREMWIEHGEHMYRLRHTKSGKLYLTK